MSEDGPAVSVPRRRPRRSRSLAQEGTSSWASQSHHSQVPRDRLSPDRLQRKLWHGGLNPAQLKSEKQVEIRISINLIKPPPSSGPDSVYLLCTPQISTMALSVCLALGRVLGTEGQTRNPRSRAHEARILGGVRRQDDNKKINKNKA